MGRAFWVYLVGVWFALVMSGVLLIFLVHLSALWLGFDAPSRLMRPFIGVFGLIVVAYQAFAFVGVWQSANRYISAHPYPTERFFLAVLAKVAVTSWGASLLFKLQQNLPLIMAYVVG